MNHVHTIYRRRWELLCSRFSSEGHDPHVLEWIRQQLNWSVWWWNYKSRGCAQPEVKMVRLAAVETRGSQEKHFSILIYYKYYVYRQNILR